MSRAKRKMDHIQYALSTGQSRLTGLDDIRPVHQSLPGSSVASVSLQTKIGGLQWSSPIFVNAMTGGGGTETETLNYQLAAAAAECGLAMAVGSQMAAIRDPDEAASFQAARRGNPNGILIANIGSEATVDEAKRVCSMIEADLLQVHLNVIQELAMPEGDRDFSGALERIAAIANAVPVPVIVKETGFGMSRETAQKLNQLPVAALDVSGFGGTNFAAVENERASHPLFFFNSWGIPTAASIVEAAAGAPSKTIIASGGLQRADDVVKSLILGASAAGLSGFFLKVLVEHGQEALIDEMTALKKDITMMMAALGAKTPADLHQAPVVISGDTHHWLKVRGLDPDRFARRIPPSFDSD